MNRSIMATQNRIVTIDQFVEVSNDEEKQRFVLIKLYPCHLAITSKNINYIEETDTASKTNFGRFLLTDVSLTTVNDKEKIMGVKITNATSSSWKLYRLLVSNNQPTTLERRWKTWRNIISYLKDGHDHHVLPCRKMTTSNMLPYRPQTATIFKFKPKISKKFKKTTHLSCDKELLLHSPEHRNWRTKDGQSKLFRKRTKFPLDEVKSKKKKHGNKLSTGSVKLAKRMLLKCMGIRIEE